MHEETHDIADNALPAFSEIVLRTGILKITTNNGDGTYVGTEQINTGSGWGNGSAPGCLVGVTVRERNGHLCGAANDYAVFHEVLKQDGSTEVVLDLTTRLCWGKITDVSNLASGYVDANPSDRTGTHVDTSTTVRVFMNHASAAPDIWIQPDDEWAVTDHVAYIPFEGDPTKGFALFVRWVHLGPGSTYLDTSTITTCWIWNLRIDERGHIRHVQSDDGNWYDLDGNQV